MLANVLILLGGIVGLTALLDLLLSDAHKRSLSNVVVDLWDWLDHTKRLSWLDSLRSPKSVRALSVISAALSFCIALFGSEKFVFLSAIATAVVVDYLAPRVFNRLLGGTPGRVTIRVIAVMAIALVAQVPLGLMLWYVYRYMPEVTLVTIASDLVFLAVGGFTSILFITAAVVLVPIGCAFLTSIPLYSMEFLVRRIAEYPKGPILALSALCGGIASILKLFS
jgi:hypothetical protein